MFSWRKRRTALAWVTELDMSSRGSMVSLGGDSVMAKFSTGAVLNWVFDQPDSDTYFHLIVRLSDAESQKVYDAPVDRGMIESIRPSLSEPVALLAQVKDGEVHSRPYRIPAHGNEFEFMADLMVAAQSVPEYMRLLVGSLNAEISRFEREMSDHKVELARLKAERRRVEESERLASLAFA